MRFNINVGNVKEEIVGDVYVSTDIGFMTMFPPKTMNCRIIVDEINIKLNILGRKLASIISSELKSIMEEYNARP